MTLNLTHLPKPVARALRTYARARRVLACLRIAAGAAAAVLAAALVAMALDLVLFLPPGARIGLSAGVLGVGLAVVAIGVLGMMLRRTEARGTAYALEAAAGGDPDERLVTAAQVLPGDAGAGEVHAALIARLATLAEEWTAPLRPARLARDRGLIRRLYLCAALVAIAGTCGAALGARSLTLVQRLINPLGNLPKPGFMQLTVIPETIVVGSGGEVVIQIRTSGDIPRLLRGVMRWAGADADRCVLARAAGQCADLTVTPEAEPLSRLRRDLFVLALSDLRESFSFRVRCGDAESEVRFAEVVQQPKVVRLRATVTPPAYTKLLAETITAFDTPLRAFAASAVEVRFGVDQPGSACRVKGPDGRSVDVEADETGDFVFPIKVGASAAYEITAVNSRGFECIDKPRLAIMLRADQAPLVTLLEPEANPACLPGENVSLVAEASDDLGLQEAVVEVMVNPGSDLDAVPKEQPVAVEAGASGGVLRHALDLGPLGLTPGDEVSVLIRARDTGGNDGRSRPVTLRIVAFTAGENERRRLAALELAVRAVKGLAHDADRSVWQVSEAAEETLKRQADAAGISVEEVQEGEALLAFLEREHHFTDRAQDKADLRLLCGVLRDRLRPVAPGPAAPADWANDCSKLLAYRSARLLALRLLGLGRETAELVKPAVIANGDGGAVALAEAVAARVKDDPEAVRLAAALSEARRASRELGGALQAAQAQPDDAQTMGRLSDDAVARLDHIDQLKQKTAEALARVTEGEKALLARAAQCGRVAAVSLRAQLAATVPEAACAALGADTAMAVWRLRDRLGDRLEKESLDTAVRETVEQHAERFSANGRSGSAAKRLTLLAAAINAAVGTASDLSAAVPGCDTDALGSLQETIALALRQVQREPERREKSARRLVGTLGRLHETTCAWLPSLREKAQEARTALQARHEAIRRTIAQSQAADGAAAHAWLLADWRLIDADPYCPLASRADWLAHAGSLAQVARQAVMRALADEGVAAERDNAAVLAAEATVGGGEGAARAADEAAFLKLAAESEWGEAAGRPFRAAGPEAIRDLCAALPCGAAAGETVKDVAKRLERLEAEAAAVQDSTGMKRLAGGLLDLRLSVCRLMAANALLANSAPDENASRAAVRSNRLLRAAWARYDAATRGSSGELEHIQTRQSDAAQMAKGAALAKELAAHVGGLRLALLRAAEDATTADDDRTAADRAWHGGAWVRAARKEAAAGGLAAAVSKWAAHDESVARAVLARCEPGVAAAVAALGQAESLLKEQRDGVKSYEAALQQAVAGVEPLEQRAKNLAPRVADEIQRDADGLAQRIVAAKIAGWKAETRARAALRLADVRSRVERLLRRMRAAAQEGERTDSWSGGPDGIWARQRRIDASHCRARLSQDMGRWEKRAVLCVLEAAETPDTARRSALLDEAEARFSAVLRVAASSLGDGGGARTSGGTEAEDTRDPVVRWLLQQADEARRELRREGASGTYREVTEQYMNAIPGFLKY